MAAEAMTAQSEALVDFLDELLSEEAETPSAPAEVPESTPDPGPIMAEPAPPAAAPPNEAGDGESGRQAVIPEWGREPFQAMVFKVRDLSLAIPLQELAGVIEWQPEEIEQQPGSMLLLGHYQRGAETVKVVDTARLIFSETTLATLSGRETQSKISRIILIDNGKIGLACDEVYEVVTLQPAQVTWRSAKTRRKWLAGTILAEMTAVLDTAATAAMLSATLAEPE